LYSTQRERERGREGGRERERETFDVSALHGVEFFLEGFERCFQLRHALSEWVSE
jgi:hypothetical protein